MTDVCLILEGTYPYKTGGVTTWIRALLEGLPELSFSVAHLYYGPKPSRMMVPIPANLTEITLIALNEQERAVSMDGLVGLLPEARVYHALSTGFAGLLGTEIKEQRGMPFILTEHGIYWHEISLGVDELECGFKIVKTERGDLSLGLTWEQWHQTFRDLARRAYAAADVITTVCAHNQSLQLSLGAPAEKSQIIPNGVVVQRNGQTLKRKKSGIRIALVGRVTPIKDVKTFIRSCALVKEQIPAAEFLIIGPTDHDPSYTAECRELAADLHLDSLTFTGEVDMETQYPAIDIMVLASVSEAQPYAVLESFAHGIPVVVTDVGGCSELVNGNGSSGAAAGILCPVGDHHRIADAVRELATSRSLYDRCAEEGLKRAKGSYSQEAVIASYRRIYERSLNREE
jgi:polysaccharide biosynthesis protein PelF